MHGVADCNALQSPLIGFAPFFDMSHQLVLLHMFISFAVELEVGFQLSVVVTKLALVDVSNYSSPFLFRQRPFIAHMHIQGLQTVSGEFVANSTLVKLQRWVTDIR